MGISAEAKRMKDKLFRKALVFGIIILFVGAGNVGAKSLYVNKDINANSPISAYDIQGPPNYLVYQMTSNPTRYGGVGLMGLVMSSRILDPILVTGPVRR